MGTCVSGTRSWDKGETCDRGCSFQRPSWPVSACWARAGSRIRKVLEAPPIQAARLRSQALDPTPGRRPRLQLRAPRRRRLRPPHRPPRLARRRPRVRHLHQRRPPRMPPYSLGRYRPSPTCADTASITEPPRAATYMRGGPESIQAVRRPSRSPVSSRAEPITLRSPLTTALAMKASFRRK